MNIFPDQISAVGTRQLEAQLQFLRSAAGSALDGAEQFAALQFATTRNALASSTEMMREVAAARDPRDLFALSKHTRAQIDSVLAYQSRLFGIASALSGSVVGLPVTVTPTATAALQKLAALPPVTPVAAVTAVTDHIIEQSVGDTNALEEVADNTADNTAEMLSAAREVEVEVEAEVQAAPAPVDDIIEQTNEVVEELKAQDEAAPSAEAPVFDAPVAEAPVAQADSAATAPPIAELNAVAAATGHQEPQPSAAPIEPPAEQATEPTTEPTTEPKTGTQPPPATEEPVETTEVQESQLPPPVSTKSNGKGRKK